MSKEKIEIKLNESIDRKHEEISLLDQEERQKKMRLEELDVKISILEEENHLQNLGFYEPKYDFRASEDYKIRFNQITAERKVMIRDGVAAFCGSSDSMVISFSNQKSRLANAYGNFRSLQTRKLVA